MLLSRVPIYSHYLKFPWISQLYAEDIVTSTVFSWSYIASREKYHQSSYRLDYKLITQTFLKVLGVYLLSGIFSCGSSIGTASKVALIAILQEKYRFTQSFDFIILVMYSI